MNRKIAFSIIASINFVYALITALLYVVIGYPIAAPIIFLVMMSASAFLFVRWFPDKIEELIKIK